MEKQASPGMDNSITHLPVPLIGDINNRRFVTALLSGIIGGAGVSAAANLLRSFREMRAQHKEDTDEDTIVLTLPKAAADGYTGMKDAKTGETKITANGGRQARDAGKYGKCIAEKAPAKDAVKCADEGNPGPNTVGTVVANTLGLAAGGLMSYEVVSRLFDALNERRLKRKLEAAQQAYIRAMEGASKRAEAVLAVLNPVEHVIVKDKVEKTAGILDSITDSLPDSATNVVRYPAAAYILALLAGTGATSYVTKKVLDREFPEEKIKKDINRPTRIVFRTDGGKAELSEGDKGKEKKASDETCAAITAMLPIYMDVVEGKPNRTLAGPYVKIAEAAGTDAEGLMKMAKSDMWAMYSTVLKDPVALWEIIKDAIMNRSFSRAGAASVLKRTRPDTYRKAVDAAIDSHFENSPDDGFFTRTGNSIGKWWTKNMRSRDSVVEDALKSAEDDETLLHSNYLGDVVFGNKRDDEESTPIDEKDVLAKVRRGLNGRRRVEIQAKDKNAKNYVQKNRAAIKKLLARLNAQGSI